jgi:hypothetical protein
MEQKKNKFQMFVFVHNDSEHFLNWKLRAYCAMQKLERICYWLEGV